MAFQILFLSLHLMFQCLMLFVESEISVLLEKMMLLQVKKN